MLTQNNAIQMRPRECYFFSRPTIPNISMMQPYPKPEPASSILRKALCGVNAVFEGVRIDKTSGKASSMDVIRLVLNRSSGVASTYLSSLFALDDSIPSIKSRTTYLRINGCGKITPVADLRTLVEMIWKLPGRTSANFRRKSAETTCRVMGGDLALLREIEQNNLTWRSVEGGMAIQQALIEPIEYKQVEKSTRVKECSVRDALACIVGGEAEVQTPYGRIDVLSGTEVIEVKYYKQWKHGLGQVLAYHSFYPSLLKRLHLFAHIGEVGTRKYFESAKSVCDAHVVRVTFEFSTDS